MMCRQRSTAAGSSVFPGQAGLKELVASAQLRDPDKRWKFGVYRVQTINSVIV